MLINLTNHPLEKWDQEQKKEAKKIFGQIIDMPFPDIDPAGDEQYIENLSNDYLHKILACNPQAVHIQGEFTFTYRILNLLREHNIKCIASTTSRIMSENEDGTRTYKFKFVRFREYC